MSEVVVTRAGGRSSVSMHRKVQHADVRKRSDVVADESKKQSAPKESVIVHFAAEPVSESELIQDAIASVTKEQRSDDKDAESQVSGTVVTKTVSTEMAPRRLSAREVKENEIKKAFDAASRTRLNKSQTKMRKHTGFGFWRVALAFATTAVLVFGIVYFAEMGSTDISLRVAAMQNGINAVYPDYTPRGYALSDITSENGKVILNFKNAETGAKYSLTEENVGVLGLSELEEYVDDTFGANYTKIDEGNLTIYIENNDAAWVKGGVLFKLKVVSGTLTRKQIATIATTE